MKIEARPWTPQDLIDDLQDIINEESKAYLNTRRTTLEMALAYLKEHFAEQKWIPVTERMPDHFGVFIVAIKEPGRERVGKDCADFDPFAKTWLPSLCWDRDYKVTHWMPLPEPPEAN